MFILPGGSSCCGQDGRAPVSSPGRPTSQLVQNEFTEMVVPTNFRGFFQLTASREVRFKNFFLEMRGKRRIRTGQIGFAIEAQTERIKIGRAEAGPAVHLHGFDVAHTRVEENADAML